MLNICEYYNVVILHNLLTFRLTYLQVVLYVTVNIIYTLGGQHSIRTALSTLEVPQAGPPSSASPPPHFPAPASPLLPCLPASLLQSPHFRPRAMSVVCTGSLLIIGANKEVIC